MKILALFTLSCLYATAQTPPPLRVFASNGIKAVAEDLKPQAEKAAGRNIAFTFDSTVALRKRIAAGEPWDLAILSAGAVDGMITDVAFHDDGTQLGMHGHHPAGSVVRGNRRGNSVIRARAA